MHRTEQLVLLSSFHGVNRVGDDPARDTTDSTGKRYSPRGVLHLVTIVAAECLLAALVDAEVNTTSNNITGQMQIETFPQTRYATLSNDGLGCSIGGDTTALIVLGMVARH